MSRQSSSVASSGASISYSLRARSPVAESYRQIFSATCISSVFPLLRLPLREPHLGCRQLDAAVLPASDRMVEEVLVVAARVVVRPGVGAAALLADDTGADHAERGVEHVPELDRLREVAVEDLALVLHVDVRVALPEPLEDFDLLRHPVLRAEDGEVLEHRVAELLAQLPGPLAVLPVEQVANLRLGVPLHRLRHLDCGVG